MKNTFLRLAFILFAFHASAQNAKVTIQQQTVKNELIQGFNYGQISHYAHRQTAGILGLTDSDYKIFNSVIPLAMRENVRCSGTVSKYQNIHEPGNGTHDNMIVNWSELYTSHNNFFARMNFAMKVFAKNRSWIFDQFNEISPRSYIYDQVEIYHKTGGKTFAFTFNTDMPYVNWCTLDQSVASLKYVYENTNVITVELGNEPYFDGWLFGSKAKEYEPKMDAYIQYLEQKAVPAIQGVVGKSIPIGIPINNASTAQVHKYWTKKAIELYYRLTAKGIKAFLVPHIYTTGYDEASIRKGISDELKGIDSSIEIRITEYNADIKAGKTTQQGAFDYFNLFNKVASEYKQIRGTYDHCALDNRDMHYSFIK